MPVQKPDIRLSVVTHRQASVIRRNIGSKPENLPVRWSAANAVSHQNVARRIDVGVVEIAIIKGCTASFGTILISYRIKHIQTVSVEMVCRIAIFAARTKDRLRWDSSRSQFEISFGSQCPRPKIDGIPATHGAQPATMIFNMTDHRGCRGPNI